MTWRDQVRATIASFRGVPFSTVDVEGRFGRRVVVHEFPARDKPFVEDLGRASRTFTVEAYVIGEDYLQRRDALIDAIEQPGSGELIHPRYGTLQVHVDGMACVKESPRDGGKAHFSIVFVEAGDNVFPTVLPNTVTQVDDAANALELAAAEALAIDYAVAGPSVLAEDGLTALQRDLDAILATVRRTTSIDGAGDLVRTVGGIATDLAALIRTPVVLAQRVRGLYEQFTLAVTRPLTAFADFKALFLSNGRPSAAVLSVALPGSTRARLLSNEAARTDFQRRTALSNAARSLAVGLQSTSAHEPTVATAAKAVQMRDSLLSLIDQELETVDAPAEVTSALGQLRAAVTRDVAARAEQLRQVTTFTPLAVVPSLLIAHRIYQDAGRADELEARNGVRHPAFVPARALEVLL